MNKISYTQRICKDEEKIEKFLLQTRVGIVAMVDSELTPYATPVNFVWHDGAIYFHGMGTGKKESILTKQPTACFTIFHEYGTVIDPVPCHADTSYMSVIIFGETQRVTNSKESATVLQKLLDKYTPNYYKQSISQNLIDKYRSSHDNKAVSVFKIVPKEMTAKENSVPQNQLFNN
ncbi:MAG: pyridoxamine 5'-phosphate oxidase family protein [Campylobacteraceae bacterium]